MHKNIPIRSDRIDFQLMEYRHADSVLSSLRSRVWLAVCVLAVIHCVAGLTAYLASTYIFSNPMIPVAAGFAISMIVTIAYGRWLADEVVRPVEKVNLAAKSLERSSSASLPATTGSTETDEILDSLQRSSRQMNNLLSLMENVAAGNTNVAVEPLGESDRLSAAFQKLVLKVTNSIDSKEELENLTRSLKTINEDIKAIRSGSLELEIQSDSPLTEEIAAAFNILFAQSKAIARSIRIDLNEAGHAIPAAIEKMRLGSDAADASAASINKTIGIVKESQDRTKQYASELTPFVSSVDRFDALFGSGRNGTIEVSESVSLLRRHTVDLQRKWKKLRETTQALHGVVRLAEDIARRSNLISLNSSIGANGRSGGDLATIADEFSALSDRSLRLQKEIVGVNKCLDQDIEETDASIRDIVTSTVGVADNTSSALESLSKIQPMISQLSDLPGRLAQIAADNEKDKEHLLRSLTNSYFEMESSVVLLRESEESIRLLEHSIRSSLVAADDLGSLKAASLPFGPTDISETQDYYPSLDTVGDPEMLELPGEN